MDGQLITKLMILITAVIWITYDFWVEYTYGPEATISDTMRAWGYDMPWLLVAWGALCWHFWGTVPRNR